MNWAGPAPANCEVTGQPITDRFVDGVVVRSGAWASMHPDTHATLGNGFGIGRGQLFERQPNGTWLCMKGWVPGISHLDGRKF